MYCVCSPYTHKHHMYICTVCTRMYIYVALTSLPLHSFLDLGLPLWLGGLPFVPDPSLPVSSQGITACIRNVYISGRLLDLNSHVDEQGTQHGCPQVHTPHICVHVRATVHVYVNKVLTSNLHHTESLRES